MKRILNYLNSLFLFKEKEPVHTNEETFYKAMIRELKKNPNQLDVTLLTEGDLLFDENNEPNDLLKDIIKNCKSLKIALSSD